jgi:hypothetical protein
MDAQRREESERRLERQRSGILQRSESGETRTESSPTQGRQQARLLLRKNVWYEEKIDERQDRKRSGFED